MDAAETSTIHRRHTVQRDSTEVTAALSKQVGACALFAPVSLRSRPVSGGARQGIHGRDARRRIAAVAGPLQRVGGRDDVTARFEANHHLGRSGAPVGVAARAGLSEQRVGPDEVGNAAEATPQSGTQGDAGRSELGTAGRAPQCDRLARIGALDGAGGNDPRLMHAADGLLRCARPPKQACGLRWTRWVGVLGGQPEVDAGQGHGAVAGVCEECASTLRIRGESVARLPRQGEVGAGKEVTPVAGARVGVGQRTGLRRQRLLLVSPTLERQPDEEQRYAERREQRWKDLGGHNRPGCSRALL